MNCPAFVLGSVGSIRSVHRSSRPSSLPDIPRQCGPIGCRLQYAGVSSALATHYAIAGFWLNATKAFDQSLEK